LDSSAALQFAFSGLTIGAFYAFVALGVSIVFSSSGIVNFAHGQFVMIGGMVAATISSSLHWPVGLAMLAGVLVAALCGAMMARLFVLPMLRAGEFPLILVTLGLGALIEAVAVVIWGTDPQMVDSLLQIEPLRIMGATLGADSIIIVCVLSVALIAFSQFLTRTRWGRAMRATAIDRDVAASLGINVRAVIVLSFTMSAAFGGLAGALLTPVISTGAQAGFQMTIKGIAAAVLGGIASPLGAVAGGFLLGIVEAFSSGYISSTYQNVIASIVLILLLLLRPRGLFTLFTRQA
jgi:branched-chain amino acid transport system permease protein